MQEKIKIYLRERRMPVQKDLADLGCCPRHIIMKKIMKFRVPQNVGNSLTEQVLSA
jgi:hypothetical protein